MKERFLHFIDLNDYPIEWWEKLLKLASDIIEHPKYYMHRCSGKVMGTLFYEPSTRTQMSFQTAMLKLGGSIIGFDNPSTTSVAKGENLKDTTKVVSNYADIVVMRHPLEGSVKSVAMTADCPMINAGDGGHLHPTQTLTDLVTLQQEKGRLNNLKIGLCGDLLNGRTTHSLCKALSCFENNEFVLISTEELKIPDYIKEYITKNGCKYTEVTCLESAISDLDVLYMTRIQKERFTSLKEYEEQKDVYVLDTKKMSKAKSDMIVLHPLPRVDEITVEVDDDPRALYFKQAEYGVFARMALILTMLESEKTTDQFVTNNIMKDKVCSNPRCITHSEKYLPKLFREKSNEYICEYCDKKV